MGMDGDLREGVLRLFHAGDHRSALTVDGATYDYRTVGAAARMVAGAVRKRLGDVSGHRIGIFARDSFTAYTALVAALELEATYVPLDPTGPIDRTRDVIRQVGLTTVVADPWSVYKLRQLDGLPPVYEPVAGDWSGGDGPGGARDDSDDPYRYILFTSGTTGRPKGIGIRDRPIGAMFQAMENLAPLRRTDRVAQAFELTFDLAQYSTLATWLAGAELVVMSAGARMRPTDFIRRWLITYWFSVPSVARFAEETGALVPASLASVRVSLFCGEALPHALARTWQAATGHKPVLNLYGPTEATIACSAYPVCGDDPPTPNGMLPLGTPFEGTRFAITPDGLAVEDLRAGAAGELLIGGAQVFDGYLGQPVTGRPAFLTAPDGGRWYRSGDRVAVDGAGRLLYCGRVDEQVQVRGHRVELRDVEYHLSRALGLEAGRVVVVPLADASGMVDRLGAAIWSTEHTDSDVRTATKACLPIYMAPTVVRILPVLPLNANGKIDRSAVQTLLTRERVDD